MTDRVSNDQILQTQSMVQRHHERISEIEKTLSSSPDPHTLRHCEHIIKELPSTDELKSCIKARSEKILMYKRVSMGIITAVAGTLVLAISSLVWQGIAKAINDVGVSP